MTPQIPNNIKHVIDWSALGTYAVSAINFMTNFVNPLLTTIGLFLAVVWWVYRIRELRRKEKLDE